MSLNQRQGEMRMRSLNKRGWRFELSLEPATAYSRKMANRRFRREMAREIRLEVDECR